MQDQKVKVGWRSRMQQDPGYRYKIVKSIWLCLSFFCLGLLSAMTGPAFMDLQIITNTNVQQASAFLSADAAGCCTGSLVAGPVYDLVSKSLLPIFSVLLLGVTFAIKPFCASFWLMVVISFVTSLFRGSLAIIGNAELLRTWGTGQGHSALQALHFTYALGSVLAPLLIEPFLAPSPNYTRDGNSTADLQPYHNTTVATSSSSSSNSLISGPLQNISSPPGHFVDPALPETRIYIGYLIGAGLTILSCVPLVVDYIKKIKERGCKQQRTRKTSKSVQHNQDKHDETRENDAQFRAGDGLLGNDEKGEPCEAKEGEDKDDMSRRPNLSLLLYLAALAWVCFFYLLHVSVESTFPSLLANYVVIKMYWSKSQGAMVTFVFWICYAASRLSGIILVRALSPLQIIMGSLSILIASFLAFLLASLWQLDWLIWVSSGAVGVAIAVLFPTGVTWLDEEMMPATGRVTAALMLSSNVGGLVNPMIVGHLIEKEGPIYMVYVFLGEIILCMVVFGLLHLFLRFYLQRRFARKTAEITLPINVTPNESQPRLAQPFLNSETSTRV